MILTGNSQPVAPLPLSSYLTSASQIPCSKGSMTFGHGQQLRTNCINMSLWETFYSRTINMPIQNLLDVFHHAKLGAKIVILSDFCHDP